MTQTGIRSGYCSRISETGRSGRSSLLRDHSPSVNNGMQTGEEPNPKILIIGLGNPILGDDGIGWRVANLLESWLASRSGLEKTSELPEKLPVEIDTLATGGLALMERMLGYENVILVDALSTGQRRTGSVSVFPLEDLPKQAAGHLASAHDTSLQNALDMAAALGAKRPRQILIVAIESENVFEFSEELSPPAAAAVSLAAGKVLELLSAIQGSFKGGESEISLSAGNRNRLSQRRAT